MEVSQESIDREVAEGQVIYDQLLAEGCSREQIREWWLANSGMDPADYPHSHNDDA